jgi:hypothetical protein
LGCSFESGQYFSRALTVMTFGHSGAGLDHHGGCQPSPVGTSQDLEQIVSKIPTKTLDDRYATGPKVDPRSYMHIGNGLLPPKFIKIGTSSDDAIAG